MNWEKCELRYLNHANLAEQGIKVPTTQPYGFVEGSHPKINDKMRNGLDVKADVGSPVFTVKNIFEQNKDGSSVTIIELEFDHIDPTPYSKVPQNS